MRLKRAIDIRSSQIVSLPAEEDLAHLCFLSHDLACIVGLDGRFRFVNPAHGSSPLGGRRKTFRLALSSISSILTTALRPLRNCEGSPAAAGRPASRHGFAAMMAPIGGFSGTRASRRSGG